MIQEKGLGVGLNIVETWAMLFIADLIDTITLPFRFLFGLLFTDDSSLKEQP